MCQFFVLLRFVDRKEHISICINIICNITIVIAYPRHQHRGASRGEYHGVRNIPGPCNVRAHSPEDVVNAFLGQTLQGRD